MRGRASSVEDYWQELKRAPDQDKHRCQALASIGGVRPSRVPDVYRDHDPCLGEKVCTWLLLAVFAMLVGVLAAVPVPAHADNGLLSWPDRHVYVVNHASARWPVRKAAERLDNGSPLDLHVVGACPSPAAQCIEVRSVRQVPGRPVGRTYIWRNGNDLTRAVVYVEDGWNAGRRYRLALTMHELFHAVGHMRHGTSRRSLTYPKITGVTRVGRAERAWLNGAY